MESTAKKAARNPLPTLYVVGGILGAFAVFKILQAANNAFSGSDIDDKVDFKLKIDPAKLSISKEQAKIFADQLLVAMNWEGLRPWPLFTVGPGTDNKVIKEVFGQINPEDFKLIYQAFGTKDYNGFGSPPKNVGGGVQDAIGISKKRDLVYWLRSELDFFDFSLKGKVGETVRQAGFIF